MQVLAASLTKHPQRFLLATHLQVMAESIQAVADDAKADLEEAMPALNAAVDSLKALNKNDITEIKSFPKPPPLVQVRTLGLLFLRTPSGCTHHVGLGCPPLMPPPQPHSPSFFSADHGGSVHPARSSPSAPVLLIFPLPPRRSPTLSPLPLAQLTMEAVCILRGEKADWDSAKKLLGESNFMTSLQV